MKDKDLEQLRSDLDDVVKRIKELEYQTNSLLPAFRKLSNKFLELQDSHLKSCEILKSLVNKDLGV